MNHGILTPNLYLPDLLRENMIIQHHVNDIQTPTGLMRTSIFRPVADGQYPSIIFYSEIFQQTSPITPQCANIGRPWFCGVSTRNIPRVKSTGHCAGI